MKKSISILLSIVLCLALSACAAQVKDIAASPAPTQTSAPSSTPIKPTAAPTASPVPTAPLTPVDLDFSQAEAVKLTPDQWAEGSYTTQKYELTLPSTASVEIAHGLDGMNGVVYVGTDEDGKQFLAVFDTVTHESKKVYTAQEGIQIVSVMENNENCSNYDDIAAYRWVETDGDMWRIMFNDDLPNQVQEFSEEFVYVEGRLSEGSEFLPIDAKDTHRTGKKLTLISPSKETELPFMPDEDATLPFLWRGGELPVNIESPITVSDGEPLFAIGPDQFIHTENIDGKDSIVFHDLYDTSYALTPFAQYSYRLPEGESLVKIIPGSGFSSLTGFNLFLLSDAGNLYGYTNIEKTPVLIAEDVACTMGTRIAHTFLLTDDNRLCTWNYHWNIWSENWESTLGEIRLPDENAIITAMAEGYVTSETNSPYEAFVFAEENGTNYIYRIVFNDYPRDSE